jgi:competence protein ComEA
MGNWIERYRGYIVVFLAALIVTGGAILILRRSESPPLTIAEPTPTPVPVTIAEPTPVPVTSTPATIKVYVTGAVNKPGVYTLHSGDRVEDAIKAAGGATAEADLTRLNLAAWVSDGQQIYVVQKGETPPALPTTPGGQPGKTPAMPATPGPGGQPGKININKAGLAELDTLPGIGPVTAQKIIDYRTKNGDFKSIQELKDQKIVNSSTYDKIKDLITTE